MSRGTAVSPMLVVDDDAPVLDVVQKYMSQQGYAVTTATTVARAQELLVCERFACMLVGVKLQGRSGIELIPHALRLDRDLAIIVLSGEGGAATAVACMRAGAADVVAKPFDPASLAGSVAQALHDRQQTIERREMKQWLKEEVVERKQQLRQERTKLEQLSAASLDALVFALESKDPYMAGHSMRVAQLAASIAAELGRSDEDVEMIRVAGRLHDIGVIGISDRILAKRGTLTAEEFEEVKRHVVIGAQILEPCTHLGGVAEFVRGHHERWDGTGYPSGLAGASIPWGARILAAAEIYDAITSARPYRARIEPRAAIEQMATMSGSTLEPAVFVALAGVVARGQALDFLDDAHAGRERESQMTLAAAHA